MRKIALVAGGVVVVLVALVLIVPRMIDWKPRIASAVQAATGREFHIDGNLAISIFPAVEFSASGIRLANAEGAKTPEMVKIGGISGKVELWPLLSRSLIVDRLVITEPELNLQTDAAG